MSFRTPKLLIAHLVFQFISFTSAFAAIPEFTFRLTSPTAEQDILNSGAEVGKLVASRQVPGQKLPVIYIGEYHGFPSVLAAVGILSQFPTLRKCVFLEGNTTGSQETIDAISQWVADKKLTETNVDTQLKVELDQYFVTHPNEKADYAAQLRFSSHVLLDIYYFASLVQAKVFTIDQNFREVNENNNRLMKAFSVSGNEQKAFNDLVLYHNEVRHRKTTQDFLNVLHRVNCDLKVMIFGLEHFSAGSTTIDQMNEFVRSFHPGESLPRYTATVQVAPLQKHIETATGLKSFLVSIGIKGELAPLESADAALTVTP